MEYFHVEYIERLGIFDVTFIGIIRGNKRDREEEGTIFINFQQARQLVGQVIPRDRQQRIIFIGQLVTKLQDMKRQFSLEIMREIFK